jgi:crotonobetainyl-CoA:carnitine CoA-transferase CaiB-like acyl-CoA transferase
MPEPWLPLNGIRVTDFSMFVPAPFCTAILADLGAESGKIVERLARQSDIAIEGFRPGVARRLGIANGARGGQLRRGLLGPGEHTREMLVELDFDDAQIADLKKAGAVL